MPSQRSLSAATVSAGMDSHTGGGGGFCAPCPPPARGSAREVDRAAARGIPAAPAIGVPPPPIFFKHLAKQNQVVTSRVPSFLGPLRETERGDGMGQAARGGGPGLTQRQHEAVLGDGAPGSSIPLAAPQADRTAAPPSAPSSLTLIQREAIKQTEKTPAGASRCPRSDPAPPPLSLCLSVLVWEEQANPAHAQPCWLQGGQTTCPRAAVPHRPAGTKVQELGWEAWWQTLGTESAAVTSLPRMVGRAGHPTRPSPRATGTPASLWTHCMDEETEAQKAVTCLTSVGGEGSPCLPGPGPPSPSLSSAGPSPAVLRAWTMTRNQECGQPPGAGRSCREHVS